jgi:acetylornithine deacetylase/succinyl-diaminopimelate desuccinylase-like protein
MSPTPLDRVLQTIDRESKTSLLRLFELLRFPSVGTDPAHAGDCQKAADWLKAQCEGLGFTCTVHATTGRPIVVARLDPPDAASGNAHLPHVLFYGHYDVQPADPVELWSSPPFAPVIAKDKNGRDCIFARGASDDKGQVMTFVEAIRAWLAVAKHLPFRLTVLIEGDEEGAPEHLDHFIGTHKQLLAADIALVCDTGLWDPETPAIVSSLRGVIGEDVTITGPRIDLHSGYFGGPATNPIKVLTRILDGMHDKRGHITIPGFYDGVKPPTAAARQAWKKVPFSEREFLGHVGLKRSAGEKGYSVLEQLWVRPTAEVNGILGGYTGAGSKTVLPAQASAKLTFRLVAGQDPKKISRAFRAYVRSKLPKDCKATFTAHGGGAAVSVPDNSPWIAKAKRALADEWGRAPVVVGEGGSIPVVENLKTHLGLDSILMGFCNEDDLLHSPNENYKVESFHKGTRAWARFIAEIIKDTPTP